jgi:hypothetical protein
MKQFFNFFTWLAILFLGGAAIAYFVGASFRAKAELATGTVAGFSVSVDSEDNSQTYCPQVRYTTKTGQDFTYNSNFCSSPPAYEVGEEVEIYYDPADPGSGQIRGFWSQYLVVLIFSCIGLPLAVLGIWSAMPSKDRKGKAG